MASGRWPLPGCGSPWRRPAARSATDRSPATDSDVGAQLAAWGKVAIVETTGRRSGQRARATVGFVEEPDGSILVAAGFGAAWAENLQDEPRCRVTIAERSFEATAELLGGADHARAIRELILRYGTPSEGLGAGPSFRLRPA